MRALHPAGCVCVRQTDQRRSLHSTVLSEGTCGWVSNNLYRRLFKPGAGDSTEGLFWYPDRDLSSSIQCPLSPLLVHALDSAAELWLLPGQAGDSEQPTQCGGLVSTAEWQPGSDRAPLRGSLLKEKGRAKAAGLAAGMCSSVAGDHCSEARCSR